MIDDCIDGRGGEMAARRRATSIGRALLDLDQTGRRRFFELLADDYDHDHVAVDTAIARVLRATDPELRRSAEAELAQTLRPRRDRLLRRFVGIDGGLAFLIELRESLLPMRKTSSRLREVDNELRQILTSWFDVALLRLERLDWDSPASLLEKLIEYEAVHAITSWDDLRGRLGPARRCFAFLHPSMPGEPLIFVEVALTTGISEALPPLLDHDADRSEEAADTAIFYSISNCHAGLAGVPLGDLLIKQVVQRLTLEVPSVTTFATLSPIPGFRTWLLGAIKTERDGAMNSAGAGPLDDAAADNGETPTTHSGAAVDQSDSAQLTAEQAPTADSLLTPEEQLILSPTDANRALDVLQDLVEGPVPGEKATIELFRPVLMRLAARYLLEERRGRGAADPVAHFHLSNGARVERINWWANPEETGWDRGLSMMVNYRYWLDAIEENHDAYVDDGQIVASSAVRRLLES